MPDLRDPKQISVAAAERMEFGDCLSEMESALQRAILAFAKHYAADGQITREQWKAWFDAPEPEGDYFDGYNAGVEAVVSHAEQFIDEQT